MHVALTDVLTCPRCGPEFGLLLVAEQTEQRRVLEGWLACANCRERYRVAGGFSDLSFGARASDEPHAAAQPEDALRLAALLGVTEGPALVSVVGNGVTAVAALVEMIPGIEVIAVSWHLRDQPEAPGISRIAAGTRLPFRNASLRGVALTDEPATDLIEEAARVVAPRARVVVLSGDPGVSERLAASGLRVIAKDARATVGERANR